MRGLASWLRSMAVTLRECSRLWGLDWPGPGSHLPAAVLPRGTQDGEEVQ